MSWLRKKLKREVRLLLLLSISPRGNTGLFKFYPKRAEGISFYCLLRIIMKYFLYLATIVFVVFVLIKALAGNIRFLRLSLNSKQLGGTVAISPPTKFNSIRLQLMQEKIRHPFHPIRGLLFTFPSPLSPSWPCPKMAT